MPWINNQQNAQFVFVFIKMFSYQSVHLRHESNTWSYLSVSVLQTFGKSRLQSLFLFLLLLNLLKGAFQIFWLLHCFYSHSLWNNESFFCVRDGGRGNAAFCCFQAVSRISVAPKPHCCAPINIANMAPMLLWTLHYILSAVCVQFCAWEKKEKTFVQLTSKLQTGSPAEDRSDCIERHTLVQPRVLVAVQAAYNEVAPRQTPSAIQAQIYESPIQWPSVRAKTPSVARNAPCSILPFKQGGLTGVGNGRAS